MTFGLWKDFSVVFTFVLFTDLMKASPPHPTPPPQALRALHIVGGAQVRDAGEGLRGEERAGAVVPAGQHGEGRAEGRAQQVRGPD